MTPERFERCHFVPRFLFIARRLFDSVPKPAELGATAELHTLHEVGLAPTGILKALVPRAARDLVFVVGEPRRIGAGRRSRFRRVGDRLTQLPVRRIGRRLTRRGELFEGGPLRVTEALRVLPARYNVAGADVAIATG